MDRFSIPKLVEDVEKYVELKNKFQELQKKSERWLIGGLYKKKVDKAYNKFIKQMKVLEVKYNPKHPIYQENKFNENVNIQHPKMRLEYNRPSPVILPSAPPYEQVYQKIPFVHR